MQVTNLRRIKLGNSPFSPFHGVKNETLPIFQQSLSITKEQTFIEIGLVQQILVP